MYKLNKLKKDIWYGISKKEIHLKYTDNMKNYVFY